MKTTHTEAIILSAKDHGESDRLIRFFDQENGRLRGVAKGARKSRERFAHSFETFSVVHMKYVERRGRIWIEASRLAEPFLALRDDLERWGYAALVTELVLEMVPEGEPNTPLFFLVKETYGRLSEDREPLNVLLLFLFRFLHIMGYLPAMDACCRCGRRVSEATRWWWTVKDGVFYCPDHRSFDKGEISLDLGTVILIRRSRELPLPTVWRLFFTREKQRALLEVLVHWVKGLIQKDLNSIRVLRQLTPSS